MRRGSTPGIKPGRTALSRRDQPFRPLHPLRRVLKPSSGLLPRLTSQGVWLARWVPHHCDPDHPRCALVGDVRCRWLLHLAQSALACLHSCRVAQRPYRSCPPFTREVRCGATLTARIVPKGHSPTSLTRGWSGSMSPTPAARDIFRVHLSRACRKRMRLTALPIYKHPCPTRCANRRAAASRKRQILLSCRQRAN